MTYTVSITSQGQISLPARIRRDHGFSQANKALISVQNGKVIIEPVKDFLEFGGKLKTDKKASAHDIRLAFEEDLAKEAIKK